MKKRILSLVLALALCLGLAVPAFAVKSTESEWNIDFPDERNLEESVSFKVRDWNRESSGEDSEEGIFTGLGEVRDFVSETLYLEPGDMITMTAKNFTRVRAQAWSDPDGDGIYDQRLCKCKLGVGDGGLEVEVLPVSTVGPIEFKICSEDKWYNNASDLYYNEQNSYGKLVLIDGFFESSIRDEGADVGSDDWVDVPISVDYLLEQYGPNTLLVLSFYMEEEDVWAGWSIFLPDRQSATAESSTASPTNDKLTVDGAAATPTAYKISGSNYFKLRDVAALLNGSAKEFDVGYDSATKSVTITTGKGYAAQSGDLQPAPAGKQEGTVSNNAVYIDGVKVELTVYKIDGNNYFMLRDLGQKLGFNVGWESGRGMFIETDKEYDPNN